MIVAHHGARLFLIGLECAEASCTVRSSLNLLLITQVRLTYLDK